MVTAMRYITTIPFAASVALALTVAGCSTHNPEPATPTAAETPETTVQNMLGNAAAMLLNTEAMHVRYSTTGLPGLTAPVYDAQVFAHPPNATGDATLLVDDAPVHASFTVADGKLTVGTEDGEPMEMGDAAGKLNPPALLDPQHGLSALVGSLTGMAQTDSSGIDNDPSRVRLEGKLPADTATLIVPQQVIGNAAELPVTVWLDQAQRGQLAQLIAVVGGGSVTLQITDTRLSGNTPESIPPVGDPSQLPPLPLPEGSPPPGAPLPGGIAPPPLPDGSQPPVDGPPPGAPTPPPGAPLPPPGAPYPPPPGAGFPPPVSGSQPPPAVN